MQGIKKTDLDPERVMEGRITDNVDIESVKVRECKTQSTDKKGTLWLIQNVKENPPKKPSDYTKTTFSTSKVFHVFTPTLRGPVLCF